MTLSAAAAKAAGIALGANPFPMVNTGLLGAVIVLLSIWLKNQLANRKLTTEVNGQIREEFIAEMHALRSEIKDLRDENDALRREVRDLHGVIDGMRRENLTAQLTAQSEMVDMLPNVSPAIRDAAKRVGGIVGDKNGGK